MPAPTSLSLWFAWKDSPKVEHEGHSGSSLEELQPFRERLEADSRIDHVTVYRRHDDGFLEEVKS